jgi:hypothetical protein
VTELEQTLRQLKARAAELQHKNEGYAEELRARGAPAVVVTGWRAAGVQALDAALRRMGGGEGGRGGADGRKGGKEGGKRRGDARRWSAHESKAVAQVKGGRAQGRWREGRKA